MNNNTPQSSHNSKKGNPQKGNPEKSIADNDTKKKQQTSNATKTSDDLIHTDLESLHDQLEQQKKEIEKLTSIAGQTQRQYILLKGDFDSYQNRIKAKEEETKRNALIDAVKKLLPAIDKLKQMVHHIPSELKENSRAKGVVMIEEMLKKELASINVYFSSAIGEEPNPAKHQPIGTKPVDDPSLVGKVVDELVEYVEYKDTNHTAVIREGKVTIGLEKQNKSDIKS